MLKKQFSTKGLPCLSLSLNVPGFPKSNAVCHAFFESCLHAFRITLTANLVYIISDDIFEGCDAAGDYFMAAFSTKLSLPEVKQVCEKFETDHQLGRFIDADLNDETGNTVSSGKSKLCFYCGEKPAIECRRENAHNQALVRAFMFKKMAEFCNNEREKIIIKSLSAFAQRALLHEIALTPKPGLVDKLSSGSHNDMDFQTFLASTSAISPFFSEFIQQGFACTNQELTNALPIIRNIGLRAEEAMYKSTAGVNTQKGIIFLMGVALFACGNLFRTNEKFTVEAFRQKVCEICRGIAENEMPSSVDEAKSHGEKMYAKYGFSGARGEAENGFQLVIIHGLPHLSGRTELNDDALIRCFLAIGMNNNDTNILYRSNVVVLDRFKTLCGEALRKFSRQSYLNVINYCKNENISPGGTADLLAVTIFVWLIGNADFPLRQNNLDSKHDI
ncbi:MAG: triphosphoribosyl-dephospho-CoA synthase [Prolixibacteraceae bacterium]|nr:triphosphoribosyl-dephospho-CoA synthase [Prolixibacteraceae bacterium]